MIGDKQKQFSVFVFQLTEKARTVFTEDQKLKTVLGG